MYERGGAKERKENEIKHCVRQDRGKRRTVRENGERRRGDGRRGVALEQGRDGGKSREIMKAARRGIGGRLQRRVGRITGNELYYVPFTCKREEETAVIPKGRDK